MKNAALQSGIEKHTTKYYHTKENEMEKKFYVPVHGTNEVKELKDLADQVSFYKHELLKTKLRDYMVTNVATEHAADISYTRDELITDAFGTYNMLDLMKLHFTYEDLLAATEEAWQALEEARTEYKATMEAAKIQEDAE